MDRLREDGHEKGEDHVVAWTEQCGDDAHLDVGRQKLIWPDAAPMIAREVVHLA